MTKKFISKESMNSILQKITSKLSNKVDKVEGKVLSSNDFTDDYKDKLDNLDELPESFDTMKKSDYASDNNEGYVKKADEAIMVEALKGAQPNMYLGTDSNGNYGAYRLPFSEESKDGGIYQMVLLNPPVNSPQSVESMVDLQECKVFIQAFKFVAGDQDIIAILKEFNNSNKDSFYYDEENVEFENGMSINRNFIYKLSSVKDFYESDEISKSDFVDRIEVKKYESN